MHDVYSIFEDTDQTCAIEESFLKVLQRFMGKLRVRAEIPAT
jgi:hypothetical protein